MLGSVLETHGWDVSSRYAVYFEHRMGDIVIHHGHRAQYRESQIDETVIRKEAPVDMDTYTCADYGEDNCDADKDPYQCLDSISVGGT